MPNLVSTQSYQQTVKGSRPKGSDPTLQYICREYLKLEKKVLGQNSPYPPLLLDHNHNGEPRTVVQRMSHPTWGHSACCPQPKPWVHPGFSTERENSIPIVSPSTSCLMDGDKISHQTSSDRQTSDTFLMLLQEWKESRAFVCVPNLLTSPYLSWLIKPRLRRISLTQDIF